MITMKYFAFTFLMTCLMLEKYECVYIHILIYIYMYTHTHIYILIISETCWLPLKSDFSFWS